MRQGRSKLRKTYAYKKLEDQSYNVSEDIDWTTSDAAAESQVGADGERCTNQRVVYTNRRKYAEVRSLYVLHATLMYGVSRLAGRKMGQTGICLAVHL